MVQIERTRTFKFEDGEAVAIRIEEYENSKGCKMKQITEEKGISLEDAQEVLNTYVPEELARVDEAYNKKMEEVRDFKNKVSEFENTREFIQFKELVNSKEFKDNMSKLNMVSALLTGEARLIEFEKEKADILAWQKQMSDIVEGLQNGTESNN